VILANDKTSLAVGIDKILLPHEPLDTLEVKIDSLFPIERLRIYIEALPVFGSHHGLELINFLSLIDPLIHCEVLEQAI
jgi:hypothetical protein